MMVRRTHDSG